MEFTPAVAAATTASFLTTTLAFAAPVPIGTTDALPEGRASADPALVGDVIAAKESPFVIDDFVTGETLLAGTVEQRVIREAATQSLTFHYLITNPPGGAGSGDLFRFSAFSFGEFVETDVNYLVDDAANGKPSKVGRSDNVVDAYFEGPDGALDDGESISFFVRTNATTYDETGFVIADALSPINHPTSGVVRSAVVEGFYRAVVLEGPVAVPLPGALCSGLVGLGAVAWAKRHARKLQ